MIKMEMPSMNLSTTLVFFTLLYWVREAAAADYIYHFCSNRATFTANSTYDSNLHQLLSSLSLNAIIQNGFYNNTVGQNATNNVHGLFLCRGDISVQDCQDCVASAVQDLTQRFCPKTKEAVIWYEKCMLRYSDQYFFSKMNTGPGVYLPSRLSIPDSDRFNKLLTSTMKDVELQIANVGRNAKKFATKEANFTGSQILYTLLQCTADISGSACSMCILEAMSTLRKCCGGIQGARVMFPSCRIRYEIYPFYGVLNADTPSLMTTVLHPQPSSSQNSG